jgi:hypothetical protein
MIRPSQVSNRPSCRHRVNSGLTSEMGGNIETSRVAPKSTRLPGNRSRAIA